MKNKNFYWLIQGDCLKVLDKLNVKIDLVLTSPPFKDEDVPLPYYDWFDNVLNRLKKTCNLLLIFNSSKRLVEICKRYTPRRVLIWDKKVGMGAYRYEPIFIFCDDDERLDGYGRIWNDCIAIEPIYGFKQLAPYQNPVKLYKQLLRYFPDKQVILDPFIGSGTTMEACQDLGRSCIGIEINPKYCEIIKKRCFGKQFLDREVEYKFEVIE